MMPVVPTSSEFCKEINKPAERQDQLECKISREIGHGKSDGYSRNVIYDSALTCSKIKNTYLQLDKLAADKQTKPKIVRPGLVNEQILNKSNIHILQEKLEQLDAVNFEGMNTVDDASTGHLTSNGISSRNEEGRKGKRFLSKHNGFVIKQINEGKNTTASQLSSNYHGKNFDQTQQNTGQELKVNKYHKNCSRNYFNNIMTSLKSRVFSKSDLLNVYNGKTGANKKDLYINGRHANNNNVYTKSNFSIVGNHVDKLNGEKSNPSKQKNNKPAFVTTVKSGKFLEPPTELALMLGLSSNLEDSSTRSTNNSRTSIDSSQKDRPLYSFCSAPRVLHHNAHLSRCKASITKLEENGSVPYGNIMYDKRVIRGSTFAQHTIATEADSHTVRQQEARRRALARRRVQECRLRQGTPPPVPGRRHEKVQTEKFLEELVEHPADTEIGVQTELYFDAPSPLPSIPEIPRSEAETQVFPGDLCDFETEVEPILKSLVSQTLETSLTEVLEEEELNLTRMHQWQYKARRENGHLEKTDLNNAEDKSLLHPENDEAAIVLPMAYLEETLEEIIENLNRVGYRLNDIKTESDSVMEWLMKEVKSELNHTVTSKDVLSDIVRDIVETRGEVYRVMHDEDAEKLDLGSDEENKEKY